MAQQPLTGRGLSQTILQPTDILGEAQLRQQQEQVLAARQQAAQKPKKPFEIKAPEETYGRIFGPLQNKVVNMYTKWASENADKIDRDSVYYDEETARQNEMYKAGLKQLSTMTVEVDNIYDKDAEGLTEYEITAGGFLNFTNEALNFGDNVFMQDGNWYYKKPEDEEPVLATQAGILTSPRSMYATFAGADEYFDKEVGTIKTSIENIEGVTTTKGAAEMIRPRIMTKLATARNRDALKRDIVLNDLMAQGGYNKPEDISQEVFEELMQNEDYVNDVINRYADAKSVDLALKAGFGKSIEQGRGGLEFNFGDWAKKLGAVAIKSEAREFSSPDMKYGVTLKTDKIQIPIDESIYQLKGGVEEDIKSYVDNIYTDGQNVLVDIRGVRQSGADLRQRGVPLLPNQVRQLQATMGLPNEVTVIDFIEALNQGQPQQEKKSGSEQDIIEVTTQEQYDSLPYGTKFIYTDPKTGERQTLTKGE